MAEGINTHTLAPSPIDAVIENAKKIPPSTEDPTVLHIQKGMSQLLPPSQAPPITMRAPAPYYYNTSVNDDPARVDSALLAAMRDPRERVALLRLEQVMIEFMNSSDGYLEVGGQYNSIVITPNKTTSRFNVDGTTISSTGGASSGYAMRPATSFQRCLLHRLADRFGILREAGSLMEGSIRLVKQKESKTPKYLLVDHASSISSGSQHESAGGEDSTNGMGMVGNNSMNMNASTGCLPNSYNNPYTNPYSNPYNQQSMLDPRQTMLTSSQSNSQNNGSGAGTGKSNSRRKMKIMKRSSSGADSIKSNGSSSSNPNNGNTPRSRKSKNFSDKEKAYAEARARIFAGEDSSTVQSSADSNSLENKGSSGQSNSSPPSLGGPAQQPPADNRSNNSSFSNLPMSKPPSSSSLGQYEGDDDTSNSAMGPVAATGMGVVPTKATYRNRRQEENDPDFQRGTLLTQPITTTTTAAAAATAALHATSYNYYASSAAGYAPQQSNPYSTHDEAAYYSPYNTKVVMSAATGRGAAAMSGRGGRGATAFAMQSSPRSPYNHYGRFTKANSHQATAETANLNCMEEFPALR